MKATKTLIVVTVFIMPWVSALWDFPILKQAKNSKNLQAQFQLDSRGYFLKTASGNEYKLALGPPWFLDSIGLTLKNGDQVSAKGFDRGYDIIPVSSITKDEETYDVFNPDSISVYSDYGRG